jgi:tRNA pseudouridine38-40 synthase
MDNRNIKLVISYDGTRYHGYQSQVCGNTIEDKLKKAICTITGSDTVIYCAGRTDSGVHARGQVVNFHTERVGLDKKNWLYALNSKLPHDIRVMQVSFEPVDFHARHSALFREYTYTIVNGDSISALDSRFALYYRYPLDETLLQEYADHLIGVHDFSSFCSSSDNSSSRIRRMRSIRVTRTGNTITIDITANAFLHNMIRIIAGTLLELYKNEEPPEAMKRVLDARDRLEAGPTIAARGLVFKRVYYDIEELT